MKICNYALEDHLENSRYFTDSMGLKYIFPFFMRPTPKYHNHKLSPPELEQDLGKGIG